MDIQGKYRVICEFCGLKGPKGKKPEEAVNLWNSDRSERCFFCGKILNNIGVCSTCGSQMPGYYEEARKRVCCYLDIIGFSSYTNKYSIREAVEPINAYSTIFGLRTIGEKYKSFCDFRPSSDGILIIGENCNEIINDVCEFIKSSLAFNLPAYLFSSGKSDITEASWLAIDKGIPKQEHGHLPPSFFEGGISFGDVESFTQTGLYCKREVRITNYAGEAVTESVKITEGEREKKHGARIFCSDSLVNQLNNSVKDKFIYRHDGLNELLWPMSYFNDSNNIAIECCNSDFFGLFECVCNFYEQHKNDKKIEVVYFNTIKLLYTTQEKYIELRCSTEELKRTYSERCRNSIVSLLKKVNISIDELKGNWKT